MTQEKDAILYPYDFVDPQAEYWATHGKRQTEYDGLEVTPIRDQVANWRLKNDPWSNGRYALAAVAWGLIILVVFGVGAGP
jgi:hypothetical protein